MKKLFFRIYLGTLLALFGGLAAVEWTLTWPYDDLERKGHGEYIKIVHPLIGGALKASPPDQWRGILDKWEGITEYQLELLTKSDLDPVGSPEGEMEIEFSSNYFTDYLSSTLPISGTNRILHYSLEDSWAPTYLITRAASYLIVIAAIAVVTYLVIRPLYAATQELSEKARKFAQGKLSERVAIRDNGPFAKLSQQFNRMAEDIQQRVAEQKIMTDAISHELKTPITRLRLALDMALDAGNDGEIRELIEKMDEDLNDLDGLTSQLLKLAKLAYKAEPLEFESLRIYELIERELAKISGFRPQVELSLRGDRSLSCRGHKVSLALLFHNLMLNGQRYAVKTVQIEIDAQNESVVVRIDDDGPGIPEENRQHVFAPFARLDGSRDRSTGSYGLGLAIVRQCVEEHGGSIHIGESPLGGARFTLTLPRETSRKPITAHVAHVPHYASTRDTSAENDKIAS